MANNTIKVFTKGVHNKLNREIIPADAAQDSANFVTKDGKVILVGGRVRLGTEGAVGKITGETFGYKVDGTKVHYAKFGTAIKYWDGSAWQNCITGLEENEDYWFANYSSLAGSFTFVNGKSAYYKIINAFPGSPISVYDASKNYYGRILIDRGRTILWNREKDKTGLYGSRIDPQNSTVYTTETDEAIGSSGSTNYTGTLIFKSNQSRANAFAVTFTARIPITPLTFTVTIGSPAIISCAGHGLSVGDAITFSTTGALPTGLTAGTVYYVSASGFSSALFQVSATPGGAVIDTSGSQSGVHTIVTASENFTDDYLGVLTGSRGGSGTINYATGAYNVTFSATTSSDVTATYQWENSAALGLADFTYSATRLAGEGFVFPQDEGGDAILNVQIGLDGAYYSLKSQSAYRLALDETDLGATNEVFRKDIGIPSAKAAVSTSKGIVFINTSNPSEPTMTILQRNELGTEVEPVVLFPHFDFSQFDFDDASFGVYGRWVLVFCKSSNAENNNRILMCDVKGKIVDIVTYTGRTSVQDGGNLYVGDSITKTVYQIFNGLDDLDSPVEGYFITKTENHGTDRLKKYRRQRLRGTISPSQGAEVYVDYDGSGFSLVGTILGTGSYVNPISVHTIGSNYIGEENIGGGSEIEVVDYACELKLRTPKFRTRTIKIVPTGIGYFDFNFLEDWDILLFEDRLPKAHRSKQNVSLDGTTTDN